MSLQSSYDDMLEDMECPNCGHIGMEPNGGLDYICPDCGYDGTFEDDEEEQEEED